jgi:hypothetical protein
MVSIIENVLRSGEFGKTLVQMLGVAMSSNPTAIQED